jgi:hypothetical protein
MELEARADSNMEKTQALWSMEEEDQPDSKWDWEPPDLTEGSEWYNARVARLREAVQGLDEPDYWLKEGLECLARHRLNYTDKGPQQLQLLWWEFPCEHWKALREGCRLGFLVSPEGGLVLNGSFTQEEREVAGRFVDKLKALGVLVPAIGELKANCPLFCVDKSYDSDQKRCITNCKGGGQNACMGKDPVYLVQKETMLWELYAGGWMGIADASKQFHIFFRRTQMNESN